MVRYIQDPERAIDPTPGFAASAVTPGAPAPKA
jgi:hypothetical protein